MPRLGSPVLRQHMFDWKNGQIYQELFNFQIEVNIFMTNNDNTKESERVQIILNWLAWEGLSFMQTLNDEDLEKCRISMGFFRC